jgi:hypothetical protein
VKHFEKLLSELDYRLNEKEAEILSSFLEDFLLFLDFLD